MDSASQSRNNDNQNSRRDGDKKRARRTRKDQDGRDFVCSCGKSYLSYPALYTHIKTKHDGKVPQKNNAENEDGGAVKEDLEQLKMFLSKYYPQRLRGTALSDLSQHFSPEERDFIMPILENWQSIHKKGDEVQKQKKIISAKRVFGKFIYDMNKRINPAAIKFLVKLIMCIHKGICTQNKNDNYCDDCTAQKVPSLFNELITNGHIPISKESKDKILHETETVCKVMLYFSNWMFHQKYTNYSVKNRY